MTDQLAFPFAPGAKTTRSKPWNGRGPDPNKRRKGLSRWRRENPDKARAQQQRWRAKNPEKVRAQAARQYIQNKDKWRKQWRKSLLKKYNLTAKEFDTRIEAQDHRCAICRRRFEELPTKRTACIDHHHGTGQIRGLLCHSCNTAIGLFRDDPDRLRAAAEYLENGEVYP
jgi:hypothetical protein